MEIVIIILVIIIILLNAYLFLIKRDLKRISRDIKILNSRESNNIIHSEIPFRELDNLISEINAMIRKVKSQSTYFERKNRQLKKMMTNISHDLRTPLTSAFGYVDILLSKEEINKKELYIIEERLKRLEKLIDSFFLFSKFILQDKEVVKEEVNLLAVIEESIANYYDDYTKEGRKIILENSILKFRIESNKEMLIRVFDNLINNAFKHSKGDLLIKVENIDKFRVEFINELLYPDLDVEHIFDEFYTVDIARTKGNTGLGLAITKEFINSLGGFIYAKKDKGKLIIVIELI